MKRKRILKILKFRGDEGLNLTRLGSGYETYAANARQIAGILLANAYKAHLGRYDEPRIRLGAHICPRRASLERYIKFIASDAL